MKLQNIIFEEKDNTIEPGMEAMAAKLAQAVEKELEANKEDIESKEGQVNEPLFGCLHTHTNTLHFSVKKLPPLTHFFFKV